MPYTHSLVAVFLWAVGCALAYRYVPKIRPWVFAAFIGLAVLSHWTLDLLVHVPDLPSYGDHHKVGFSFRMVYVQEGLSHESIRKDKNAFGGHTFRWPTSVQPVIDPWNW